MPTFTMRLSEAIESLYGETMDPDDFQIERKAFTFNGVTYGSLPFLSSYNRLGLGDYPIFNEDYRPILNGKIIDKYWFREIGVETIEMFVWNMRMKMNEIMPFYNQLYESTLIEFEALDTMRINSVGNSEMEGEEKGTAVNATDTKTKAGARVIASNFPQTMLAGNGDYASNGTDSNSTSEVDSDGTQTNETENKNKSSSNTLVTGYQGAASDLILKYRNTILNNDVQVVADVEDMFMLILEDGSSYFSTDGYRS